MEILNKSEEGRVHTRGDGQSKVRTYVYDCSAEVSHSRDGW